jgi:transcriptional regulator with XRE-family HTH domain
MIYPEKRKRVPPEARIIGMNLRHLRRQAGLTQLDIGKSLDVTFQQVQKYEAGQNRLPIEKLYLLKHLYKIPYEDFFNGFEEFFLERFISGKYQNGGP